MKFGIDLGATNSKLAIFNGLETGVIRNSDGSDFTPSVVWLNRVGQLCVGRQAKQHLVDDAENVCLGFKAKIGTDTEYHFARTDRRLKSEELQAELIKSLREEVRQELGEDLQAAVITVPAAFVLSQCEAMQRAARLGGLTQSWLLQEPVAAALAYGLQVASERRLWLVFDWGGNSFNVAIVWMREGHIHVINSEGDNHLGGDSIDQEIVEQLLIPAVSRHYRLADFRLDNPRWAGAMTRLKLEAERSKARLSAADSVEVLIDFLCYDDQGQPVRVEHEISKAEVENLAEPYIERTVRLSKLLLAQSRLGSGDIEKVVLVGGQTLMPCLRQRLAEPNPGLGIPLEFTIDPVTALARGAAIFAGSQQLGTEELIMPAELSIEPAKSRVLDENVQFTVYRPQVVRPLRWYPLLAFAHLSERPPDSPEDEPDPVKEVQRQAKEVLGQQADVYQNVTQDSSQPVPREGELTFVPEVEGIEFNPPQRTFRWLESVHREEFRLCASSTLDGKTARGRLTVFLGSSILADVNLAIRVDSHYRSDAQSSSAKAVSSRPYRKVFASYSHKDAQIVQDVEAIVGTLGDQYLRDCHDLRAGEVRSEKLKELIEQADLFQLFWSRNSMFSPFVQQEWEHALSLRRPNFVRPTYWEEPLPECSEKGLPPQALQCLHFQRLYVSATSHLLTEPIRPGTDADDAWQQREQRRQEQEQKEFRQREEEWRREAERQRQAKPQPAAEQQRQQEESVRLRRRVEAQLRQQAAEQRGKRRQLGLWSWAVVTIGMLVGSWFLAGRLNSGGVQAFEFETAKVNANGKVIDRVKGQARFFAADLSASVGAQAGSGESVKLEMVELRGGVFEMGSPESDPDSYPDEHPRHRVTVRPFFIGKYEVTQAQWRVVARWSKVNRDLDPDPSYFKGDNLPVERVSWYEAVEFCDRLSQQTKRKYRLPSEAEWEYACRAGTTGNYSFGDYLSPEVANYLGAKKFEAGSSRRTIEVGSLKVANAFGLFDMHGNVWEWCQDVVHRDYQGAPTDGSAWLSGGSDALRIGRGGSWYSTSEYSRSAFRGWASPDVKDELVGFRVVAERQP